MIVSKKYTPISSHEFLYGLEQLEIQGIKLPKSKGELLTEIISNTQRKYQAKRQGIRSGPINANDAIRTANKRKDSEILRDNMIKAGRDLPEDTDAHHIVPANEARLWAVDYAIAARGILRAWGISINDEANGVALPKSSKIPVETLPNAYPHKTVHTRIYYINIAEQLSEAESRPECIDILRDIGKDLENGTFPIRKANK